MLTVCGNHFRKRTHMGAFQSAFQEAHLEREEINQTAGASGHERANNVKHIEMEYVFIHFSSLMTVIDAALTELRMINGNLTSQFGKKED